MFNAVYVISRARLQVARNSLWRGKIGRKLGTVALLAVLGLVAWGIYQITGGIVRFLRSPEFIAALQELAAEVPGFETDFQPYLAAVPSLVFFGLLLVLVMSSFSTVLSALYLSGDIDMLLIAPVPMRAVFTVKFLGALLPQYILLAVVLLPFLLGYGVGMGYGARYALVALLLLLLTPLFPGGLGALLVMAAVRVLPARRAREIVGVLGGLIGVAFYLVTQLAGRIVPQFVNAQSVSAILSLNSPLLPSAWAGRALVAAGEGDLATLLLLGSAFTLLSLLSFGGCLLLAERLYYVGWANLANQGGRVRRDGRRQEPEVRSTDERPRNSALYAGLLCFLPVPSRAILVKDLRLFRRDLRNLQQLIFPLAIAAFWMFQLLMGGANASANASSWERTISDLASAGIVFYVCVTLSSTMAGAGISREGKAMYLMKTAPVREREVLLGKVALAYLPYPSSARCYWLPSGCSPE
jgi:ABC-2 type transport system permease protein